MSGTLTVISGIGTGVGKSVVTGLLAAALRREGCRAITQKVVQTGCSAMSDDILRHRRLMGTEPEDADRQGLTCPFVFPFPASPHLSARLAGSVFEPEELGRASTELRRRYPVVLLEGVGGLLVPLSEELLFIDHVAAEGYPLILVTGPWLGSINHTLLSLEACRSRGIRVQGLVYNRFGETDRRIGDDTLGFLRGYLRRTGSGAAIVDLCAEGGRFGAEDLRLLGLPARNHSAQT
ncbi:dethiobiotin synthase [Chlorobium sp. N1]|uniref:dethiobiotin synthase n=1 Tax=Chlorobium sp. N1 TaxID=2491138 RepID=UPI0010409553|nr:dethiobiotin synthase [Chlorobium sp. N1]TCD48137.1 ATP-dependent dethiobiotin synthetase BioD [Chlorobium sp. N1]